MESIKDNIMQDKDHENSNIDEEELQDQILDEKDNFNDQEDFEQKENSEENNENDYLNEDEDEIKKDFEENNLNNLNNQTNDDVVDFKLNFDNIQKGVNLNYKQEFFDIFFDPAFYTNNRKIEVEKLVNYIQKDSNHGLTGLKNLKNSGFMNSIIQCLSHTLDLTYFYISKNYINEVNKKSISKRKILTPFYSIISTLWTTTEKYIMPTDFKQNLQDYFSQYSNNNAQFDASEFLFKLLDILSEQQNQSKNNGVSSTYNNYLELEEIAKKMEGESDVQASKRFWNFHKSTNDSIITDLFHGQYKSTITCLVCENNAVYFEPFSSLTLEIPNIQRVDFLLVSSHFNLKPVIKLTCFIPVNALFQDIAKFTIEKFRKESSVNEFSERKTKLKCLLVNTTTFTSRFVKLNDNIYQTSKKGNIVIYEIDDYEDESDYYPYICMIRESCLPQKKEEEGKLQDNEELKFKEDSSKIKSNNQDAKEEGENVQGNQSKIDEQIKDKQSRTEQKKKENLIYNYNRKEEKQTKSATGIVKEKEAENDIMKNLSFPRLFNLSLDKTVRDLRINLYAFMRKIYKFNFTDLKNKFPEFMKTDFIPLNQINLTNDFFSDADVIKNLNESDYESYVEEEFRYIFEENFKEICQTDFLNDFPYTVKLVSAKDDLKFKVLFSNNPDEYNVEFPGDLSLSKLNQYIKIGYKLVLEINKYNSRFTEIKNELNKVISIQPKNVSENNNDYNKTITLEDCFDNFTLAEKLEKGNEWYCSSCKKNQNSLKRLELYYIPKNLIIILKRFETKMIGKSKIQIWKNNSLVKYPVNNLSLGKYFISNNYYKDNKIIYDLYAISQHSGSLEGGHYAAACRNFGKWYEIDDTTIFPSDEETIVSPEGYILFYRRKEQKGN